MLFQVNLVPRAINIRDEKARLKCRAKFKKMDGDAKFHDVMVRENCLFTPAMGVNGVYLPFSLK